MVGGHDPLVVQAEAAGQVETAGQAAEVRNRIGGGTGEALVVIGAEASEHGIGLFQGSGLSEAKFADQAILTSTPGTLDAALGLRRVGGDLLDAACWRARPSCVGDWVPASCSARVQCESLR